MWKETLLVALVEEWLNIRNARVALMYSNQLSALFVKLSQLFEITF